MPEGITSEDLFNNIVETLSETVSKPKSVSFLDMEKTTQKLFGRQKPVHHMLGGGKSADVLLWRDKKMSTSVLGGATVVWVVFEWLNYSFLPLLCFVLVVGLLAQFIWSLLNSSSSSVPRVVLPNDLFVKIATSIGAEVNRILVALQDIACGGDVKQLFCVIAGLLVVSIVGNWCNLITVIYVGFILAHTLPVLYEKYDDQIDGFVLGVLGQLQHQFGKLDTNLLSKIPKGSLKGKKFE